jgi:hypothetical protein
VTEVAQLLLYAFSAERLTAKGDVVVVGGSLNCLDLATNVELLDVVTEVGDSRVGGVIGTHDLFGFERLVKLVHVTDGQDGKGSLVTGVTEGDASTGSQTKVVDVFLGDVEGDGHGENEAIGEAEGVTDAAEVRIAIDRDRRSSRDVVLLLHEALERGETTVDDELQVTQLTLRGSAPPRSCTSSAATHLGQEDVLEVASFLAKLLAQRQVACDQVL